MAAPYTIVVQQLAQIGHAEKIVQELQSHPEVQRQMAEQLAAETLKRQGASVEKTDDAEKSRSVSSRDKKRRERQERRAAHKKTAQEPAEDEESPGADSPWSGNILNLKI